MIFKKILKFGGSSLATSERIQKVIEIILAAETKAPIAVVVSAMGGVTDGLISIGKMAASGNILYKEDLLALIERHTSTFEKLVSQNEGNFEGFLNKEHLALEKILEGVFLVRELSHKTLDHILSFGERLSSVILAQAIRQTYPSVYAADARDFIATDCSYGNAKVDYKKTNPSIQDYFKHQKGLPIITGFIGSTEAKETTTLGRGGSDYTAAIVGAALDVEVIEIWTDVDGVMTADPRKEPLAFSIPEISYREAMEMSHFGAKVIHPPTIRPAMEKGIPLLIKNSFNPGSSGTLISKNVWKNEHYICGISSIDHAALLSVEGTGILGVCGTAKRIFGALAEKGINIILISQGSSEHSICFAVAPQEVEEAAQAIEKEFALEMQTGLIDPVKIGRELSVVAVVGENMCKTPGISGRLFGALGKFGINVIAIAQGSSELNISVVVKRDEAIKAIRTIHEAFFLTHPLILNVFLIGVGLIGKTLLSKIHKQSKHLRENLSLEIRIVGLSNSQKMLFQSKGIPLKHWETSLNESNESADLDGFIGIMKEMNLNHALFVDCTSNQSLANAYPTILNANIPIVTPNKKANSGSYAVYKHLKEITAKKGVKFLYGANVGAGLPIITTIKELIHSGDKIHRIEAILSGTLSYLFNSFKEGKSFSSIVHEAQKKGYSEPDPREDLNGQDVARKLLILARESGYPIEMDSITVESYLPEECFSAPSIDSFFDSLKAYDLSLERLRESAEKEGKVLRYMASFEDGKGIISLRSIGKDHPFHNVSGSDNIIAITSEFYNTSPLIIKGPGAGADVTAGKVLADIVRLGLDHFT